MNIVKVANGKLAQVIVEGECYILEPKNCPYVFQGQNFEYHDSVEETQNIMSFRNLVRVVPTADQILILTVLGKRYFLTHDPEDFTTRYFSDPLEAIGLVSTETQIKTFPLEKTNSSFQDKQIFPINESLSIVGKIEVQYKVTEVHKLFLDSLDIKDDPDKQIAICIQDKCFIAISEIIHQFIPTEDKTAVSLDDLMLIKKMFLEQALPQIATRLGIKFLEVLPILESKHAHEETARETIIVGKDAEVYASMHPNLLFTQKPADDDKKTQNDKNDKKDQPASKPHK